MKTGTWMLLPTIFVESLLATPNPSLAGIVFAAGLIVMIRWVTDLHGDQQRCWSVFWTLVAVRLEATRQ